jgi:hypothetical protein
MYNPFFWPLFCIGAYYAAVQAAFGIGTGPGPEVTRDTLGRPWRR